jgi:anthranilate synthase / indole-3-glycerol phosphate synthase / phosphoribosylanthranilate isomerase
MHTEHDALPVVAGNGDSSFLVAATLAALVLAGSALVYRKSFEQQPEREKLTHTSDQPTPDDMDTEKNHLLDGHKYADADGVSLITYDPDSKESKSSRSKDRRRRGKDPLKEILKGGKKVKATTTMHAKQLFTGQPILDDLDNLNNIPSPSTPASSSTRNSTPDSLSRASGKRTQPDDRLYNLTGPPLVGTVHYRPTSEVSQSNTGSQIPDQPHPHQHTRDRTASFTSDHHVSQSSPSSHNETEDNTSILDERNPDFPIRQTRESDPTPSIFSTIIQNNSDFSEIINHSLPSSVSSATTSGVITPATSPSLSYTSSKLVPHVGADSDFANNGSGSNCGPKNNPVAAGPSHAFGADTKTHKQQTSPNPTPSKPRSKSKTKAQSTWEWDNTGEVPPSSSSISASGIASAPTSLITAPAFSPDIVYRKPPRLQPKSLWSKNAKNDGPIPGSVSHPSLLSPTSGSFAPSDSALLSPSISSYPEKVPSRVSKAAKVGEGGESEEERYTTDDSYTQLEFPTLNPTSTTLASNGGSTASSSAAGMRLPRFYIYFLPMFF